MVSAANQPSRKAAGCKAFHASARRLADTAGNSAFVEAEVKVKAHRNLSTATDEADRRKIYGNCAADAAAVAAQALFAQPTREERHAWEASDKKLLAICKTLAATYAMWPRPARMKKQESEKSMPCKKDAPRAAPGTPHCWEWYGTRWRCNNCLAYVLSDRGKVRRAIERSALVWLQI